MKVEILTTPACSNCNIVEKMFDELGVLYTTIDVIKTPESHIQTGLAINVNCDYCDGEITSQPKVLKFGRYERFFCCTSCRTLYKDKYGGRINSLSKQNLEK